MDTLFTKIINREIPAKIIYEDDQVLAFHDIAPQAPVHFLVIPKKPVRTLNDLTEDDKALGGEQNVPGQRFIVFGQVVEGSHVLLGDHQEMHRCLGGNIVEGQYLVILVNDIRGYFSVDDLGEQSIHSCFSVVLVRAECTQAIRVRPAFCLVNAGSRRGWRSRRFCGSASVSPGDC